MNSLTAAFALSIVDVMLFLSCDVQSVGARCVVDLKR